MTFFDSGLVNFIKLLLIVGLISMLYILMMQKIKEQNHKISSLLSLVTTMANEITMLKNDTEMEVNQKPDHLEPKEPIHLNEKNEISDDSEYDSDSDSDSESSINLEEIDLVKGDKITMTEMDFEENVIEELFDELNDSVSELENNLSPLIAPLVELSEPQPNVKKMTVQQLIDLAVSKKLKTQTEANRMKKKDLQQLFD